MMRIPYIPCLVISALLMLPCSDARSDTKAVIDATERLPRPKRIAAYEKALADKTAPAAYRLELTRAFARHAQVLSPAFAKEKFPFDIELWTSILSDGFHADPRDLHIADALAQLHIDRNDAAATPVVKAMKEAHPQNHHARAFSAWCAAAAAPAKSKKAEPLLTFPVHFIVITKNQAAHKLATRQQCVKECEILNRTFRTLDGQQLAHFEFKGYAAYEQVKAAPQAAEMLRLGDGPPGQFDTSAFVKTFNACTDARLRDPAAINFYIYDSYSANGVAKDTTSHGRRNSNRPLVLIDWQRLNNQGQNAEAHEMGHAFGLEHVGVPGAKGNTSTNIMTSVGEQFGSGGRRDLGFTPAQAAIIRYHAQRTAERLRVKNDKVTR